ncbi:elongation factor 1-gamma 2-like [Vicia villosa]|uniref:elongation factor 1-gamma 2-like n=1 Tax=Vicia villosa TaxID=3911 RepID=UPI00273CC732|nr:elongation factor 1-gamma 2-like [Vicia villosa]
MALILHTGEGNKNAYKALIAAEYASVQVQYTPNFEFGVSNKTPQFLKMNPLGKVPVLETLHGPVFESNAIARYVARSKDDNTLYGSSLVEYPSLSAQVEQWIDFSSLEIDSNILRWYYSRLGYEPYLPPSTYYLYEPKKEAKKVAEKSKEAEAGEEAPKPKPKNPLDLLPPCKMVLDEWKRLYSNTKSNFREVAIKGFWDMYDPEGYSLWFCDYKYQDENTVSFVTLNKVGGFLQRMDLARKYAFGKMLIIGSEPPFKMQVSPGFEKEIFKNPCCTVLVRSVWAVMYDFLTEANPIFRLFYVYSINVAVYFNGCNAAVETKIPDGPEFLATLRETLNNLLPDFDNRRVTKIEFRED